MMTVLNALHKNWLPSFIFSPFGRDKREGAGCENPFSTACSARQATSPEGFTSISTGLIPGFTSKYRVSRLVYFENTNDVGAAIEKRAAQAVVAGKEHGLSGVESMNPKWEHLRVEKTDKSRLTARDPSTSVGMTEKTGGNTDKSELGNG